MSLLSRITSIDKKFAWGFLGVLLALAFGSLAIYTSFFQERKPSLKFEIISNTSVFDVHENVSSLEVLFAGKNIQQSGQALRIITLRVINDGQVDILKSFYDDNDPLGFILVNGTIVDKPELLHVSNDYLGKNLKVNWESPQKITFTNVILETNEFYSLKLLVLSPQASVPDISPVGKVAGVRTIQVTRLYRERSDESFWHRAFGGSVVIQLTRLFSYSITLLGSIIALLIIATVITEWKDKRKRRKLVAEFKRLSDIEFNQDDDFIFQSYLDSGGHYLARIESVLSDEHWLKLNMRQLARGRARPIGELGPEYRDMHFGMLNEEAEIMTPSGALQVFPRLALTRQLVEAGFIRQEGEDIVVSEKMKITLGAFLKFLRIRKALPEREETLHAEREDKKNSD